MAAQIDSAEAMASAAARAVYSAMMTHPPGNVGHHRVIISPVLGLDGQPIDVVVTIVQPHAVVMTLPELAAAIADPGFVAAPEDVAMLAEACQSYCR